MLNSRGEWICNKTVLYILWFQSSQVQEGTEWIPHSEDAIKFKGVREERLRGVAGYSYVPKDNVLCLGSVVNVAQQFLSIFI
jgi:hypothetical protein